MSLGGIALDFPCAGETLLGILTVPARPAATGVVIVVGGRQYRAGSHRQFVLLARRLAEAGYASLRFDLRGMGDSTGAPITFEDSAPDIGAAIAALRANCPAVRQVALWGLCDGASAGLLYWQGTRDPAVAGLCLVNPWIRSVASLARTTVRHYYRDRLLSMAFWRKLLTGGMAVGGAIRELLGNLKAAGGPGDAPPPAGADFRRRMEQALLEFPGGMLLILSGADYTAREFADHLAETAALAEALAAGKLVRLDVPGADHTFSSPAHREASEFAVCRWLAGLDDAKHR